ncbi:MAG: HEAT repeat domain-containing protein [Chlamydiae bacterium]|nr:HEAT repeat domain-containing protein [Chlamydiota bacterium]
MRIIPSSQEFYKFVHWIFSVDLSLTKKNMPRLFTQAMGLLTLIAAGSFLYKSMASRSYSLSFVTSGIKNIATNWFGSRKEDTTTSVKSDDTKDESSLIPIKQLTDDEKKQLDGIFLLYLEDNNDQEYITKCTQFCEDFKNNHSLKSVVFSPTTYTNGWTYPAIVVTSEKSAVTLFGSPTEKTFDVYGSKTITFEKLREDEKSQVAGLVASYRNNIDREIYDAKSLRFCEYFKKKYSLAFVQVSHITYPNNNLTFTTVDLVEQQDAEVRLKFTKVNVTVEHNDPDGLLAKFGEYWKKGAELTMARKLQGVKNNPEILHPLFGHTHQELAPYESIFSNGVEKHSNELIAIFRGDSNPSNSAKAAFLLGYKGKKEGNMVVAVLQERMQDEDQEIRNNVLRVFAFIAEYHHAIQLPLDKILPLLNGPLTTDRNKAAGIVCQYLRHQKGEFIKEAELDEIKKYIPTLQRMEQLNQPNNRLWAKEILKVLKDSYGVDINKSEKS